MTPVVLVLTVGPQGSVGGPSASVLSRSALAEALRVEVAGCADVEHVFVAVPDADGPALQAVLFVLRVDEDEAIAVAVAVVGRLVTGCGVLVVAAHRAPWHGIEPTPTGIVDSA